MWDGFSVTIQSASGVGQKLVLNLAHLPHENVPAISITPIFVSHTIKFGIANGWAPSAKGAEFRLGLRREVSPPGWWLVREGRGEKVPTSAAAEPTVE